MSHDTVHRVQGFTDGKSQWLDYSNLNTVNVDTIRKPSHYAEGRKYEPWEVIMDWKLNYLAGSAVKYISRYERKGTPEQDLRKAIRFLEMELEHRANNSRLG